MTNIISDFDFPESDDLSDAIGGTAKAGDLGRAPKSTHDKFDREVFGANRDVFVKLNKQEAERLYESAKVNPHWDHAIWRNAMRQLSKAIADADATRDARKAWERRLTRQQIRRRAAE